MFIDASVIVAILNHEAGSDEIVRRIEDYKGKRYVSPLVRFEAVAAIARLRSGERRPTPEQFKSAQEIIGAFCDSIQAHDVTITPIIGDIALEAAATYGKFTGHKADLNFGDCFSYACAKAYHVPLIYKGNDFVETDLA
jgi:ribonuclease VapC